MATFYVLPSRHMLGRHFSEALAGVFPEISHTPWDWPDLAEAVAAIIERQGNAHVIYREDLDESVPLADALVKQFGAAPGDRFIVSPIELAKHAA